MKNLKETLIKFLFFWGQSCMISGKFLCRTGSLARMHLCQVRSRCPQDQAKHPMCFFLFAPGIHQQVMGTKLGTFSLPVILECTWWFSSQKKMGKYQTRGAEELKVPGHKLFLLTEQFFGSVPVCSQVAPEEEGGRQQLPQNILAVATCSLLCPPQACTHFTEGGHHA